MWVEGTVVIVRGEVQVRRDEPGILCNSVSPVKAAEEEMNRKEYHVWITIHLSGTDEKAISDDKLRVQDLYRCIAERPGRDHYDIIVANGEWQIRLTPGDDTLNYSPELHKKIEEALNGEGHIEVQEILR